MISDFGVIGLGAVGSSLLRALHERGASAQGFDADARTVSLAQREGYDVRLWSPELRISTPNVIICVPIRASIDVIAAIARRRDYQLITDVGSTKRMVNAAAQEHGVAACFVGGHPLAGTELSGWAAGASAMFENKTVFLCPTRETDRAVMQSARALWQLVGARTQEISAEAHDERIAWLSHLPQLSASALALALRTGQVQRAELGRGGSDMTRLAASSPGLWLDILETNADNLDEPLGCMIEALTDLRLSLRANRQGRIADLLQTAQEWSN